MSIDPLDDALQAMRDVVVLELELEQKISALRDSYSARISAAREIARNATRASARSLGAEALGDAQVRAIQVPVVEGEKVPGGPENALIVHFLRSRTDADVGSIARNVLGDDTPENRRFVSAHLTTLKQNNFAELVSRGVWRATRATPHGTPNDPKSTPRQSLATSEAIVDPP